MAVQSRGPTNPFYHGKAEEIDPTYLALIQILQQMMAGINRPSGQPGPGGSYNPFAWMDEGGLSPDQKRAADEQRMLAERMQAQMFNAANAERLAANGYGQGMLGGLGKQSVDENGNPIGEWTYTPTQQDIEMWNQIDRANRSGGFGSMMDESTEESVASTGGSRGSTGGSRGSTGGSRSSGQAGMLTPEMLTAFMKSFQGGGADTKVLESIDTELQWLRENPGATPEEKQANAARTAELQKIKDQMLSGSGVQGGGMVEQFQQLLSMFTGPQRKSVIQAELGEGVTGKPTATRFGTGNLRSPVSIVNEAITGTAASPDVTETPTTRTVESPSETTEPTSSTLPSRAWYEPPTLPGLPAGMEGTKAKRSEQTSEERKKEQWKGMSYQEKLRTLKEAEQKLDFDELGQLLSYLWSLIPQDPVLKKANEEHEKQKNKAASLARVGPDPNRPWIPPAR